MYDSKIVSAEALAAGFKERIQPLRAMVMTVAHCAAAAAPAAAVQDAALIDLEILVRGYAQAGTVARRRVDTLVEQAGIESVAGCRLIATRVDHGTPGTTAAARFLHRRMTAALQRIDSLLPLAA